MIEAHLLRWGECRWWRQRAPELLDDCAARFQTLAAAHRGPFIIKHNIGIVLRECPHGVPLLHGKAANYTGKIDECIRLRVCIQIGGVEIGPRGEEHEADDHAIGGSEEIELPGKDRVIALPVVGWPYAVEREEKSDRRNNDSDDDIDAFYCSEHCVPTSMSNHADCITCCTFRFLILICEISKTWWPQRHGPQNPSSEKPFVYDRFHMLHLTEEQIRPLLTYEELIPTMERALVRFSAGEIYQPVRSVLRVPEHDGLWGLMPAVDGEVMGIKLVTVFEHNAAHGLPTHQAVIQLLSSKTGEPLASIDGRLITEMRTAAVSAVATRLLSKQDARVLTVLGTGVQARAHIQSLRLVRSFDEIRIWGRTPAHAQKLAEETGARAVLNLEHAVRGADVVVTVAHVHVPLLQGRWLGADTYVNAVAAVGPDRRELD